MRPFFLLCALMAPGALLWWLGVLLAAWTAPGFPGGAVVWHAYELIYGFSVAAVTGFLLTALPEFTEDREIAPREVRRLVMMWLAARGFVFAAALPAGGRTTALLAGLASMALVLRLIWIFLPALKTPRGQPHLAFLWALVGLLICLMGFHLEAWLGESSMRWLHLALSLLMLTIIVAMSRISIRIVNQALQDLAERTGRSQPIYLARPPRRQLALLCIALHAVAVFNNPEGRVGAWLAWAVAAAILNLLADWHIGRALLARRPLMLYWVYLMMALGYALLGASKLLASADSLPAGAGTHVLTIGALGLNVFVVISIAGRAHAGLPPTQDLWVPAGAGLIIAAAVLRSLPPSWTGGVSIPAAALAWSLAWLLLLRAMAPVLWRPRTDGCAGCAGPAS